MPQDQLFKQLLHEFFRQFLELFYPDIAAHLDFDKVTFLDKEVFTDLPAGSRREADLVARVDVRDGGEPEIILIHIEIQTSRRGAFPRRMFEYYALFRRRHNRRVYSIALYLSPGAGGIVDETYVEELFGDQLLRFTYKAVGLPDLPAESYVGSPNPLGPALSAWMRSNRTVSEAQRMATILSRRAIMETNEAQRALLLNVVGSGLRLDDTQQAEFQRILEAPELREVRKMITSYEQHGIEIGERLGLLNGLRAATLQIIQARFGKAAPTTEAYLKAIDDRAELERLLTRIATAETIEAVGLPIN